MSSFALEGLDQLFEKAQRALVIGHRLQQEVFSTELALEADRVFPEAGLLSLHFSPDGQNAQLALESFVTKFWEFLKNLLRRCMEMLKKLWNVLTGKGEEKFYEARAEEISQSLKKGDEKVKKTDQPNLDTNEWVDWYIAGDGRGSPLAKLLQTVPAAEADLMDHKGGWAKVAEALIKNSTVVEQYFDEQLKLLAQLLEKMPTLVTAGSDAPMLPLFDQVKKSDYPTIDAGGKQLPLKEAIAYQIELHQKVRSQPGRAMSAVSYGKVFAVRNTPTMQLSDRITEFRLRAAKPAAKAIDDCEDAMDKVERLLKVDPDAQNSTAMHKLQESLALVMLRLLTVAAYYNDTLRPWSQEFAAAAERCARFSKMAEATMEKYVRHAANQAIEKAAKKPD